MATNLDPCPLGHDSIEDVIALYRRDVDVSLLRSRLRLTLGERLLDIMRMQAAVGVMRGAASPNWRDDGRRPIFRDCFPRFRKRTSGSSCEAAWRGSFIASHA